MYKVGQTWWYKDFYIVITNKTKRKTKYYYDFVDMYGERVYGITEKQLTEQLKKFIKESD